MALFINPKTIAKQLEKTKKYHVVFLGDSITSAEFVHPNWREMIEYVLKEELPKIMGNWQSSSWGIRCFNAGFDGATSKDMLGKLDEYVLKPEPDLAIGIISINDKSFKLSLDEHEKNVRQIIKRITQAKAQFVFCTSPSALDYKTDNGYESYVERAASVFPQPNTLFINLYEKYQKSDLKRIYTFISEGNEITGEKPGDIDPDHPNQLGNAYIAKVILQQTFGIDFDPEKFIESTLKGDKYPKY